MGKIILAVIIFLVVGGYMIKVNSELNLDKKSDQTTFVKKFIKWVYGVGKNTANLVGYASNQDWLPEKSNQNDNKTNSTLVYLID